MKTWLQQLERTAARWVGMVDHHTQPITTQVLTGAVFTDSHTRATPPPTPTTPIFTQATPAPRTTTPSPVPSRRLINKLRDV